MQKHGHRMVANNLEEDDISHFDHDLLRSMGVDSAKDRLLILNMKTKHLQRKSGLKKLFSFRQYSVEAQSVIIDRFKTLEVDEVKLLVWTKQTWLLCDRGVLIERGYLAPTALEPGSGTVIAVVERSELGTELLNKAKDMLWAALYGTEAENVHIRRVERELLIAMNPTCSND